MQFKISRVLNDLVCFFSIVARSLAGIRVSTIFLIFTRRRLLGAQNGGALKRIPQEIVIAHCPDETRESDQLSFPSVVSFDQRSISISCKLSESQEVDKSELPLMTTRPRGRTLRAA